MKNKEISNINDFKSRIKKLYEYKIHDLNLNREDYTYNVQEDENDQPQSTDSQPAPQPEPQKTIEPQPAPQPEPQKSVEPQPAPVEQKPIQQPAPTSVDNNQEEMNMMSFLKSEMQKLDNVVNNLEKISVNVDMVSNRLDTLTKVIDEIREPSDIEKLEMRAFDSYPYNQTLTKVWDDKLKSKEEQDMERMGIYKKDDGYEAEYTPQKNFNHSYSSNKFNNF